MIVFAISGGLIMKVLSWILFAIFSVVFVPQAKAVSIHQQWGCGPLLDYRGQPVLGAPHFSLLCLLVTDRSDAVSEKSCILTQTQGSYPSRVEKNIQFPLLDGVAGYLLLDEGRVCLKFHHYTHPLWRSARVFTPAGSLSCQYPVSNENGVFPMEIDEFAGAAAFQAGINDCVASAFVRR